MNTKTKLVELRKIKQGEVFTVEGSDDRYTRGPYCHADKGSAACFLCRHTPSMTHHHFLVNVLVTRAK